MTEPQGGEGQRWTLCKTCGYITGHDDQTATNHWKAWDEGSDCLTPDPVEVVPASLLAVAEAKLAAMVVSERERIQWRDADIGRLTEALRVAEERAEAAEKEAGRWYNDLCNVEANLKTKLADSERKREEAVNALEWIAQDYIYGEDLGYKDGAFAGPHRGRGLPSVILRKKKARMTLDAIAAEPKGKE